VLVSWRTDDDPDVAWQDDDGEWRSESGKLFTPEVWMPLPEKCEVECAGVPSPPPPARERVMLMALKRVTDHMDRAGGDGYGMPECPWCKVQDEDRPHLPECELMLARQVIVDVESALASPPRPEPPADWMLDLQTLLDQVTDASKAVDLIQEWLTVILAASEAPYCPTCARLEREKAR
jgi:hypothetical protein